MNVLKILEYDLKYKMLSREQNAKLTLPLSVPKWEKKITVSLYIEDNNHFTYFSKIVFQLLMSLKERDYIIITIIIKISAVYFNRFE